MLTVLDWHSALVDIRSSGMTIREDDEVLDLWHVFNAQKFETPEFFDLASKQTLSGSLIHDGVVYLALQNEYQKKR